MRVIIEKSAYTIRAFTTMRSQNTISVIELWWCSLYVYIPLSDSVLNFIIFLTTTNFKSMKVLFAKVTLTRENGSLHIWIVTYHCETWSTWYILPLLLNVGLLIYSVWSFYTSLFVLPLEKEFKIQKWKDTGFKFEIVIILLKTTWFFDTYQATISSFLYYISFLTWYWI